MDDIDIEEHDVLDNPLIRNIFPDITKLKTEVPYFEDDHPEAEPQYYENLHENDKDELIEFPKDPDSFLNNIEPFSNVQESLLKEIEHFPKETESFLKEIEPFPEDTMSLLSQEEHLPNDTDAIMKEIEPLSKDDELFPKETEIDTNQEEESFEDTCDIKDTKLNIVPFSEDNEEYMIKNKIILGSKPMIANSNGKILESSPTNPETLLIFGRNPSTWQTEYPQKSYSDDENDDVQLNDCVVLLEDFSGRLGRSKLFCNPCGILFVTQECFDTHNFFNHPFLTYLEKDDNSPESSPKFNNVIRLGTKNTARKSTVSKPDVIGNISDVDEREYRKYPKKKVNDCAKVDTKNIINKKGRDRIPKYLTKSSAKPNTHTVGFKTNPPKTDTESAKAKFTKPKERSIKQTANGKLCNHCNKHFTDDSLLITHLYEILTAKSKPVVNKSSNSKEIMSSREKNSTSKTFVPKQDINSEPMYAKSYYRCHVCSYYFKTADYYRKHMRRDHLLEKYDLTEFIFNPECRFCPLSFADLYHFNCHIKRKHRDIFLMKKPNKVMHSIAKPKLIPKLKINLKNKSIMQVQTNTKHVKPIPMRQCMKCKEIFSSRYRAAKHRKQKHPYFRHAMLFKKIFKGSVDLKKVKIESNIIKNIHAKSKSIKPESAESLPYIPKDVLFKCKQCQVHFISYKNAVEHSRSCLKYKGDWKCYKCRKNFFTSDIILHKLQHNFTDSFNVVKVVENTEKKLLNKCPKCNLFVHEHFFTEHCRTSCDSNLAIICKTCNMSMHKSNAEYHSKVHKEDKISGAEMIMVEFVTNNVQKDENRSATATMQPKTKKHKSVHRDDKEVTVYFCKFCKVTWYGRSRHFGYHLQKKCIPIRKERVICKTCGFMTSKHPHSKFCIPLMGRKYKVIRVQDNKQIEPELPAYPKCVKCNVNYCRKVSLDNHECTENFKTCLVCKKKFSDLAFTLHLPLHQAIKPTKIGEPLSLKMPTKPMEIKTEKMKIKTEKIEQKIVLEFPTSIPNKTKDFPELIMKYEQLTKMCNLLYLCKACGVVTDSYDQAIDHSQDHNKNPTDVKTNYCYICKLKFIEGCFAKHQELHAQNDNLKKESFKILKFDHTLLQTDDWYKLFRSLTEIQVGKIIKNSIYFPTHSTRMRIVQQGNPDTTQYKCGKCKMFVNISEVSKHCSRKCPRYSRFSTHCDVCNAPFRSVYDCQFHKYLHDENKEPFRIVVFNSDVDKQINHILRKNRRPPTMSAAGEIEGKFYFLQCGICKRSLKSKHRISEHTCSFLKNKKQCNDCGLYTSKMKVHQEEHANNPNLKKRNVLFIIFKDKNDLLNATVAKISDLNRESDKCGDDSASDNDNSMATEANMANETDCIQTRLSKRQHFNSNDSSNDDSDEDAKDQISSKNTSSENTSFNKTAFNEKDLKQGLNKNSTPKSVIQNGDAKVPKQSTSRNILISRLENGRSKRVFKKVSKWKELLLQVGKKRKLANSEETVTLQKKRKIEGTQIVVKKEPLSNEIMDESLDS